MATHAFQMNRLRRALSNVSSVGLSVALVTACASGDPVRAYGIHVSAATEIVKCKYLDTVYGTSSWYGVFAEKGLENARLSAFDKAQKLSGTNLVWEPIAQTHGSSQVAAKVYSCKQIVSVR